MHLFSFFVILSLLTNVSKDLKSNNREYILNLNIIVSEKAENHNPRYDFNRNITSSRRY